ncbi:MAG: phosphoglycolate phosphatase [Thermoproteota archaeon]|nr:phosphoglycolate phosphatase [Thermoproteota archaeon]
MFAIDIDGTITINGEGMVNLEILSKLRYLIKLGYKIVYVTGRSSVEAFILSVFGGTTKVSVGENGGVITKSPTNHILLADKEKCMKGYHLLAKEFDDIEIKQVFPRMTEVVLTRTFDIDKGNKIFKDNNMDLILVDSNYAYHINEKKINKAYGLGYVLNMLKINPSEVVAIGDSETDIPMFELCENSVSFESSNFKVKKMAKYIVDGKNGEGLINALDLTIRKKTFD